MIKIALSSFGLLAVVVVTLLVLGGIPKGNETGSLSKIQTIGLPQQGIVIAGPSEGEFATLLAKQSQKISGAQLRTLKSSSVFVINNSGQSIAALNVNWALVQPDGRTISHAVAHHGGLGVLTNNGSPNLMEDIAPNGSRLFSLIDLPDPNRRFGFTTGGGVDKARQLSESTKVTISIDGVLFVDGTFVGPDSQGFFRSLKAEIEARRDLIEEMAQGLNGDAEAMRHVESLANGRREIRRASADQHSYYDEIKETQASLMLARRSKIGDKALLDAISAELSKPRITLRELTSD